MLFEENFLTLTVTVRFQKNEYFKNVNFLIFFSVNKLSWFLQDKFTFREHFENHRLTSLIILKVW